VTREYNDEGAKIREGGGRKGPGRNQTLSIATTADEENFKNANAFTWDAFWRG